MIPNRELIAVVVVACALAASAALGAWFNGTLWENKYQAREITLQRQAAAAVKQLEADLEMQRAISRENDLEYQKFRAQVVIGLDAARRDTRVIRVCNDRAAGSDRVPEASAGTTVADAAATGAELPAGDAAEAGAVLDPQWLYQVAAEADGLRGQVLGLQAELKRCTGVT